MEGRNQKRKTDEKMEKDLCDDDRTYSLSDEFVLFRNSAGLYQTVVWKMEIWKII